MGEATTRQAKTEKTTTTHGNNYRKKRRRRQRNKTKLSQNKIQRKKGQDCCGEKIVKKNTHTHTPT